MERIYYVDWNRVDKKEAAALVDAAARYLNTTNYPSVETMCAILAIECVVKGDVNESN